MIRQQVGNVVILNEEEEANNREETKQSICFVYFVIVQYAIRNCL